MSDFKLFKFTLLLSVTLIFDWFVMSRTGALMISCFELWIASASILIICQLISLKVNTFKQRQRQKDIHGIQEFTSTTLCEDVHVCACINRHKHILHAGLCEQNKNILLIYPTQRWQEFIPDLTLYLQKVTGTSHDFQSAFKTFYAFYASVLAAASHITFDLTHICLVFLEDSWSYGKQCLHSY